MCAGLAFLNHAVLRTAICEYSEQPRRQEMQSYFLYFKKNELGCVVRITVLSKLCVSVVVYVS